MANSRDCVDKTIVAVDAVLAINENVAYFRYDEWTELG
jgi:hypothetical protein